MWEIIINGARISRRFTHLQWSGGIKGTSRVLEVEYDDDTPAKIEIGSPIFLLKDNERLFQGKIFTIDRFATKGTFSFKAFYIKIVNCRFAIVSANLTSPVKYTSSPVGYFMISNSDISSGSNPSVTMYLFCASKSISILLS